MDIKKYPVATNAQAISVLVCALTFRASDRSINSTLTRWRMIAPSVEGIFRICFNAFGFQLMVFADLSISL